MDRQEFRGFSHQLLVISPHRDDAEIFCGGLLVKMASLGYRTAVVDLTEGELSSYGSPDIRRRETQAAGRILKLAHRENLGLPDCGIHESLGEENGGAAFSSAAAQLSRAIRVLRPEVLAVPYWQDRHPDHVQAANVSNRAVFLAGLSRWDPPSGPPHIPRLVLRYSFRVEFTPSFIVDISSVAERKYEAISCYRSQFEPPEGTHSPTLLASPLSLRSIKAKDMYLGAQIGTEFGEGYLCQTTVRIDDPIQHSRNLPTAAALLFRSER